MVAAVLHLERVTKYFGTKRALHEGSLTLRTGEHVAVAGDNGSGKSTLLSVSSGVLDPDAGRVLRPACTGYAPEKPDIPDHLLVSEWLDLVGSLKGARQRERAGLGVDALLGRRVSALSTGQRQRVSLWAALLGHPPLLVLDEPTNGLDADARSEFVNRVRDATLLVATHDDDLVKDLGARVVRLKDGRITRDEAASLAM